jgi:hypothetical protein
MRLRPLILLASLRNRMRIPDGVQAFESSIVRAIEHA